MGAIMSSENKLLFMDPTFFGEDGKIQVTVRDGHKWNDIVYCLPYIADIYKTGEEDRKLGEATIVGKMVLNADDIPDEVLKLEHSPSCRTADGLFAAMRRAYGEDWESDREVTVLFFEFLDQS